MPWIAVHDGEKKAPRQVPIKTDVDCPECGDRMRVRRQSSDGKARHFFHPNGGGEGGSKSSSCNYVAESDAHKKWKSLAADRLEQIFSGNISSCEMEKELEAPHTDKEIRLGDAVVEFESRDEQLGDGLVVEVQHKNESKDIAGTTKDYIQQDYAVAWLDSDDFADDRCRLMEVDFRARAADAIDLKFFPSVENWTSKKYEYYNIRNNWRDAYESGLVKRGAEAVLPPEWCDEKAESIWRSQRWHELFSYWPGYKADQERRQIIHDMGLGCIDQLEIVLPPDWYDEQAKKIWRSQAWEKLFGPPEKHTDIWCYSKAPATVVKHWVEPTQKQYWNSTEWGERFQGTHDFLEIESADFSLEAKVPFEKYIESSEGARLINAIRDAYDSGRFQRTKGTVRRCPHCDVCEVHDPIHDGEIKRTTTCSSCGEWYTVWDKTSSEPPNC